MSTNELWLQLEKYDIGKCPHFTRRLKVTIVKHICCISQPGKGWSSKRCVKNCSTVTGRQYNHFSVAATAGMYKDWLYPLYSRNLVIQLHLSHSQPWSTYANSVHASNWKICQPFLFLLSISQEVLIWCFSSLHFRSSIIWTRNSFWRLKFI